MNILYGSIALALGSMISSSASKIVNWITNRINSYFYLVVKVSPFSTQGMWIAHHLQNKIDHINIIQVTCDEMTDSGFIFEPSMLISQDGDFYLTTIIFNSVPISIYYQEDMKRLGMYYHLKVMGASQNLIHDFLISLKDAYMSRDPGGIYVQEVENNNFQRRRRVRSRHTSTLFLKEGLLDDILKNIDEFLKNRPFYHKHGIPFRRGYLFHGPPGCGKTSCVSVIASKFKLQVCIINLSSSDMDDTLLRKLVKNVPSESILLIEDIDSACVQRNSEFDCQLESKKPKPKPNNLTLSGLLNALDGIGGSEGCVVIMTTNHPERLDPALKRPGRVDMQVSFDLACKFSIKQLFYEFYKGTTESSETIGKMAEQFSEIVPSDKFSIAIFMNYLMRFKNNPDQAISNISEITSDDKVIRSMAFHVYPDSYSDNTYRKSNCGL